jgi:glycosyltransferase involved in cell wall biosynthesis
MRILYDHQVFSLQDAGGASRYHFELIRGLQATSGLTIEALLGLNNSVLPFASLRQANTRIWGRQTPARPGLYRYAANEIFSAAIAPSRGAFDIYHPTLYRALPWVRRRRIVVTHHDCIHERFPNLFSDAASIVRAKSRLFQQADAILCVSASSRNDLLHFYRGLENKSHVIHHGFFPLPEASQPIAIQAPYLLYVGSRSEYKNFGLLLHAFSRSGLAGDFRLLALGGGDWREAEKEQIASLRLQDSVVLIPKADESLLSSAYQGATLFVYPSLYEGFGFPPLEAMSLGCPALVQHTSSLPEICGEAAFYFESSEPGELAQVLTKTLADTTGLTRKRALGREQVKRYDWKVTALQSLAVYDSVLRS